MTVQVNPLIPTTLWWTGRHVFIKNDQNDIICHPEKGEIIVGLSHFQQSSNDSNVNVVPFSETWHKSELKIVMIHLNLYVSAKTNCSCEPDPEINLISDKGRISLIILF